MMPPDARQSETTTSDSAATELCADDVRCAATGADAGSGSDGGTGGDILCAAVFAESADTKTKTSGKDDAFILSIQINRSKPHDLLNA